MNTFVTWQNLLNEGIRLLEEGQIEESEADAREMMLCLLGWDFGTWLWNRDETPDVPRTEQYLQWIRQRLSGDPVQYVTGVQCFMGMDFKVSPAVLIPRMDTEVLVETVLGSEKARAEERRKNSVNADTVIHGLDLCTGSGCIAVSIASFDEKISMTACDISEEALVLAKANSEKLLDEGRRVTFVRGNLLDPFLKNNERFDFVVSNPPYISKSEILTLDPKVKDHEPMLALDGGEDGLDFYRRIAKDAPSVLNEEGRLYLEIGEDQGVSVPAILRENGWKDVQVLQDLAGLDRVVLAVKG